MKLKYYFRGLAVGILLTTMILAIANAGDKPLTDAQIRQRALELGMIEADSQKLSSLKGEDDGPESQEPTGSVQPESEEPTGSVQPESEEPTGSVQPESEEPTGSAQPESEEPTDDAPTGSEGQPESNQDSAVSTAVILKISGGDSSYSVSKKLAAAGLVEDAAVFDAFLCDNGYSRSIHTGTYEILPGTSQEEIAKMIAG